MDSYILIFSCGLSPSLYNMSKGVVASAASSLKFLLSAILVRALPPF